MRRIRGNPMKYKILILLFFSFSIVAFGFGGPYNSSRSELRISEIEDNFEQFTAYMEFVRNTLKIPGMSAAVLQDQELVWAVGFGYADIEKKIVASRDTPYGLASVSKPIASVLMMQLVEEVPQLHAFLALDQQPVEA